MIRLGQQIGCMGGAGGRRSISKSVAYPLGNKFLEPTAANGEIVLALNPVWAA